jgi:hypothetical protein
MEPGNLHLIHFLDDSYSLASLSDILELVFLEECLLLRDITYSYLSAMYWYAFYSITVTFRIDMCESVEVN